MKKNHIAQPYLHQHRVVTLAALVGQAQVNKVSSYYGTFSQTAHLNISQWLLRQRGAFQKIIPDFDTLTVLMIFSHIA
ncbi:MAG: hypothetical protein WC782_11855 [Methylococcaceae bacterium]|jgi:hypothetical protein